MPFCARFTLLALVAGCASTPQQANPDPVVIDSRLQDCKSALENQLPRPHVIKTCAKLYSKTTCQDAFSITESMPPAQLAENIIRACQIAYCPVDAAICEVQQPVDFLDETHDWLALWGELNAQILPDELGGDIQAPEARLFSTLLLNAVIFGDAP